MITFIHNQNEISIVAAYAVDNRNPKVITAKIQGLKV